MTESNSKIPAMMVSKGSVIGVDSFTEITPEKIQLKPVNATDVFKPNGVNKVSFRIPAYSNSFMDCGSSFITFKASYDTTTSPTADHCMKMTQSAPVFNRMTVKTSSGLVIDDITNYGVLSQLNTAIMPYSQAVSPLLGRSSNQIENGVETAADSKTTNALEDGVYYVHKINAGVLSSMTKKYLPLHLMDGGSGFCLELDLYLNATSAALKMEGVVLTPMLTVSDVVYNMEIRRIDESLCKKFNQIVCDDDAEIRIPFTTMHSHTNLLKTGQNQLKIHESATNLKRIWNVFMKSTEETEASSTDAYVLRGGSKTSNTNHVIQSFNGRIGSKWIYNSPIDSQSQALFHVKNALGCQDKLLVCESETDAKIPKYYQRRYVNVLPFEYTNEDFVNGISSSTPVELYITMPAGYTSNDLMCFSFTELSYDLSIKNGQVRYVEQKPGSNSVY